MCNGKSVKNTFPNQWIACTFLRQSFFLFVRSFSLSLIWNFLDCECFFHGIAFVSHFFFSSSWTMCKICDKVYQIITILEVQWNKNKNPLAISLRDEIKMGIFNGQFTLLHSKACYWYGPINGMLIVVTHSISETMRSYWFNYAVNGVSLMKFLS